MSIRTFILSNFEIVNFIATTYAKNKDGELEKYTDEESVRIKKIIIEYNFLEERC